MVYVQHYESPLGNILLASDETALIGLWIEGGRFFAETLPAECLQQETHVLAETRRWLDVYFSGEEPDFTPPLNPAGSEFRQAVWRLLLDIPYGQTTTYGAIADLLAKQRGVAKVSAQAVGGAIGHNEISLIIPCHRVVGANGNLTGYGSGLNNKIKLLQLEGIDTIRFFLPKD